ncbi:Alpha/Beta hydrolase protein [Cyathus striatus]|nr:Alpha/Beta hydrolase protein [Cyathus striatus]
MDTATYKKVLTQRGCTYAYYHTPNPHKGRPTVLLLHGFPSTAEDWSSQYNYLIERNYGVIAPDMLGYGGTDNPTEADAYKGKDMAQDVVDILDTEGIERAVVVSHDWGVLIGTRLVNYHPDRVLASIFISHGCFQPDPQFSYEKLIENLRDVFGYWDFFASNGAAALIEEGLDTFYTMFFAADPDLAVAKMASRGKFRPWMESNNRADLPLFWSEDDKRKHQAALMKGGLQGPLNWYVARVRSLENKDDETVPNENYRFRAPTLFISTLKDVVCIASVNEAQLRKYCDQLSVKEIDSNHWVMFEKRNELNKAFAEFLAKL